MEEENLNKVKKNKNKFSFAKFVIIPLFFGILGATLVISICFGIPSIRDKLLTTQETISANNSANCFVPVSTKNVDNTNSIALKEFSETGVSVASKVLPSVVGITVEFPVSSVFTRQTTTASAEGSGIIISDDGYILTNNHIVSSSSSSYYYVVGDASKVTVYLYNDETAYDATIIGTDELTDLAVIKIEKEGLKAAEIGNSDNIQVGEYCMAVGNPLGMQSSVSAGIVSAVNREVQNDGKTFKLIQTDAAINRGNSGGALVNSQGQIIGVNTLKMSGEGIEGMGFAIPINSAKSIYQQLIEYKKVKRPNIGIDGKDLSEENLVLKKQVFLLEM